MLHSSRSRFAARISSEFGRIRGSFMVPEMLIGIVVAAVAIAGFVAKLLPKRKPPYSVFQCGRCGTAARHNDRTTDAWRSGKTKFFCQACHAKWLQSHPPRERESYAKSAASSRSGCFGMVVLFALLPLAGLLAWARA